MSTASRPRDPFRRSSGKTFSLVEVVHGPSAMVDRGPDDTVFAFPIVAILELLLFLGLSAFLLIFSFLKDAPLEELANPLVTTDPAKAPWYFMGLQEMLEHMHPTLAGVVLPALAVLLLVSIPYIDRDTAGAGRWFCGERTRRVTLWMTLYGLMATPLYVLVDNAFPPREIFRGSLPAWLAQAGIPGLIFALLVLAPVLVLWRMGPKPTAREVVTALFTLLMVSALVLTVTGFLFRGPGFELFWPWAMPGGYNPWHSL